MTHADGVIHLVRRLLSPTRWQHLWHSYDRKAVMMTDLSSVEGCQCDWFRASSGGPEVSHIDSLNTLRPGDSYICLCLWTESSLVQVLAYSLLCTKPLPELVLTSCGSGINFIGIDIKILQVLLRENAYENVVCRTWSILFRSPCVSLASMNIKPGWPLQFNNPHKILNPYLHKDSIQKWSLNNMKNPMMVARLSYES